jgi:hypothetical protein
MCDPQLPSPAGGSNGYRMRGDRCEGIYTKEVAGGAGISLVSFTRSAIKYDLRSDQVLPVAMAISYQHTDRCTWKLLRCARGFTTRWIRCPH